MIKRLFIILLAIGTCSLTYSQSEEEKEYNRIYEQRIQLSRIDGVYIPANIEEAFEELQSLSEPAGLVKFKQAPEAVVAAKLKGGLGRWMLINWGFYEGSRLSHYLKSLGVHHPEDMSQLLLVSFHRHLNQRPLRLKEQADQFQALRKAAYEARIERDTFKVTQ